MNQLWSLFAVVVVVLVFNFFFQHAHLVERNWNDVLCSNEERPFYLFPYAMARPNSSHALAPQQAPFNFVFIVLVHLHNVINQLLIFGYSPSTGPNAGIACGCVCVSLGENVNWKLLWVLGISVSLMTIHLIFDGHRIHLLLRKTQQHIFHLTTPMEWMKLKFQTNKDKILFFSLSNQISFCVFSYMKNTNSAHWLTFNSWHSHFYACTLLLWIMAEWMNEWNP